MQDASSYVLEESSSEITLGEYISVFEEPRLALFTFGDSFCELVFVPSVDVKLDGTSDGFSTFFFLADNEDLEEDLLPRFLWFA